MECGLNNFIFVKFMEDIEICDDLINYYKNSNNKFTGTVYNNTDDGIINTNYKSSTEVILNNCEIRNKYLINLTKVLDSYVEKYYFSYYYRQFGITENIKIQHYKKNEGYKAWHTERCSSEHPFTARHLVFMTYLNDVNDEGETEFFYQQTKIKPKKGLTVIWPADWTHTHRGIVSSTEEKFIVTGWFNFI